MTRASNNPFPSALFAELAAKPDTPAAGFWRIYAKADGFYVVDDAGVETGPFGAGGSGASFKGARVRHSVAQSIPNATITALAFDSERYDTDGFHDPATNNSRLTIPAGEGGTYFLAGAVGFVSNATGERQFRFLLNGTTLLTVLEIQASSVGPVYFPLATEYELAAGDYVELVVYQNSGGALNVPANANYTPEFMISKRG